MSSVGAENRRADVARQRRLVLGIAERSATVVAMTHRRPAPAGFTETLDRLVELDGIVEDALIESDDLIIKLTVETKSPTMTIAERLGITAQSVASRRDTALKRRARRLST